MKANKERSSFREWEEILYLVSRDGIVISHSELIKRNFLHIT
jgi:hypothetical protein